MYNVNREIYLHYEKLRLIERFQFIKPIEKLFYL